MFILFLSVYNFWRKKAVKKATEWPAREETSRECSARRRERVLKNGRNITAYVSYRSLFNIMLPVWEATLDEIESKLLELSALQMRSLCEMLKLNVGEGETHTPRTLRRRIMQHLEGDDVVLHEDEGLSILLDAKEKIDSLRNNDEVETDSSSSAERETNTEGQKKTLWLLWEFHQKDPKKSCE